MFCIQILMSKLGFDDSFLPVEEYVSQTLRDLQKQTEPAAAGMLAKFFYHNLALKLQESSDITLEDLFNLMIFEEANLNSVCKYNSRTNDETKEFIHTYVSMQDAFFSMTADVTGYGKDELFRAYDDYYKISDDISIDTGLLTGEKQDFAIELLESGEIYKPYDNLFTFG